MQDEGMLPDTQMLTSVARAIANDAKMKAYDDSSHSFKQKRSALDDGDRRPLLIQSEVDTSVNNKYKQIKYGEKNICSADVWTLQDWQWKFLVPEHGNHAKTSSRSSLIAVWFQARYIGVKCLIRSKQTLEPHHLRTKMVPFIAGFLKPVITPP
jgi:hypothetical protein